jgi:hypothetical protein
VFWPKFLAKPLASSASFEAITGKSSANSHFFALAKGWFAKSILAMFTEARMIISAFKSVKEARFMAVM